MSETQKTISDDTALFNLVGLAADHTELLGTLDLVDVSREAAKTAHEDVHDAVALLQVLERRLRSIQ